MLTGHSSAFPRTLQGDLLNVVWVVDSDKLPFYRAERYHQFHHGLGKLFSMVGITSDCNPSAPLPPWFLFASSFRHMGACIRCIAGLRARPPKPDDGPRKDRPHRLPRAAILGC